MTDPDDLAAFDALGGLLSVAEALDLAHAKLTRYVVFSCPEAADAATLYAAATHAVPRLEFAARLVVKSPVKRCGKSRLLDVLAQLVRRPLLTSDISAAALVRSIDPDDPPTLMLDEADATFGGAQGRREGRAPARHPQRRLRPRPALPALGRDHPGLEDCPTFAMAVLAGIGVAARHDRGPGRRHRDAAQVAVRAGGQVPGAQGQAGRGEGRRAARRRSRPVRGRDRRCRAGNAPGAQRPGRGRVGGHDRHRRPRWR